MATSMIDDTSPTGFVEPQPVPFVELRTERADLIWTLFGATIFAAFLCYVALT